MTTPLLCIDATAGTVRRYLRPAGAHRVIVTDEAVVAPADIGEALIPELEKLRTVNRLKNLRTQKFAGAPA